MQNTEKFDKQEPLPLLATGDVVLTVTGELIDGSMFFGTDTVKVTD